MSRLKRLIVEIHQRSVWQALVVYLGASYAVLEAVDLVFIDYLALPRWLFVVASFLLLLGLPIVVATSLAKEEVYGEDVRAEDIEAAAEEDQRLRLLTWRNAGLSFLAAFAIWGVISAGWLIFWGPRVPTATGPVTTPAGPAIAVLPFRVVGPDLQLWREGMMDLVSFNLDDVAGLRKIDPRAILGRWRSAIGHGVDLDDPQAAIQIARDLGAKYALVGGVVGLGAEVRVTADLYDVPSGRFQGKALVEGSPDSVYELVDRLSVRVLQAGLVAELANLPEPSIGRLMTDSLQALIAYLEGEQKYRRSHFREAVSDYTRAVEADSTFAMALYRLSEIYAWLEGFTPRVAELKQSAERYSDRVSEREALLFRGAFELAELRLASIKTLEQLTTLYPDDVEGWYKLGEAGFFLGDAGFYPRERFRNAYSRAIELDPSFGQLYQQLTDDAFHRQDSSAARELIAALRQIDSTSHEVTGLTLTYAMVWGDDDARARASAALDTADTDVLVSAMRTLIWAGELRDKQLPISLELTRERHPEHFRIFGHLTAANTYQLWGRLAEARRHLDSLPEPIRYKFDLEYHIAGYPDSPRARIAAEGLAGDSAPDIRFWLGALAAREGRWNDVDGELDRLEATAAAASARGDSVEAQDRLWYADALRGYAALQRGDDGTAVRFLEGVLPSMPYLYSMVHQLVRYELGRLALDQGRYADAARHFRSLDYEHLIFGAPIEYYLGQAYEGLGDAPEARRRYDRFARWWSNCDPEYRPLWERGRAALTHLGGSS